MIKKLILGFGVCFIACQAASYDQFLFSLARVESKGQDSAVGDDGRAIGRFQIHKSYFLDAKQYAKFNFGYSSCTNAEKSAQVVKAYFLRYNPQAVKNKDWESLARLHNGGPSGQKNTDTYWNKVKIELEKFK